VIVNRCLKDLVEHGLRELSSRMNTSMEHIDSVLIQTNGTFRLVTIVSDDFVDETLAGGGSGDRRQAVSDLQLSALYSTPAL